jgi:hypothetical protein
MKETEDLDLDIDNDDLGNDDLFDDFSNFGENQSPLNKHNDLLKELTNFDPIIQRRIRNWLGLEWDDKIRGYVPKKEAIINEKGAKWAIGVLETYQAKTNIITNLSKNEYKNIQIELVDMCWKVFPCKFDEFGIKDTEDQYRLSQELQHSSLLVLAGAGDGKYTKFLGESVSRTENVRIDPQGYRPQTSQGQKKNMLDSIKDTLLGR